MTVNIFYVNITKGRFSTATVATLTKLIWVNCNYYTFFLTDFESLLVNPSWDSEGQQNNSALSFLISLYNLQNLYR